MQRSTSSDLATESRSPARFLSGMSILSLLAMLAPVHAQPDPVLSRGFGHTTQDRAMVEQALARANSLLPEQRRMVGSWTAGASTAPTAPPIVYVVSAPKEVSSNPAAVPSGCKCVFVNPAALSDWIGPHSSGTGRMKLDGSLLLTFMLLHEAGHIAGGHDAGDFEKGRLSQLNVARTVAKANEEKADDFAATIVRTRSVASDPASLTAGFVAMELTKLGWNMQAYRSLDQFGATAIGAPAVFMDDGYTHPNLAWRMLRSNHLIQGTDATRQLLENFEDARRVARNRNRFTSDRRVRVRRAIYRSSRP